MREEPSFGVKENWRKKLLKVSLTFTGFCFWYLLAWMSRIYALSNGEWKVGRGGEEVEIRRKKRGEQEGGGKGGGFGGASSGFNYPVGLPALPS